jgi:glycosyltransferase involved in cell wall biosynthesis
MKILQINKFFYLHGGASRYFFELSNLLKKNGHQVAHFSMHDKRNYPSYWSKYFISHISYSETNLKNAIKIISRIFYSVEARSKISVLLDEFSPDIAHLHSIYHHISPSILLELKRRRIPTVMTVHDFHLIAPNHTLFHNGKICEITKPDKYFKSILHKCVKNSYFASFLDAAEHYFHKILNIYEKNIDAFICPSIFYQNKLIEYGIPKQKLCVINSYYDIKKNNSPTKNGRYILYFGRLSEEKGLQFLLNVMKNIPKINLLIAGQGPLSKILKNRIKIEKINNVKIVGFKYDSQLEKLIRDCKFTILPSLCYENFPLSILESFSYKKPVVASNIGGITEIITNNQNGLLFTAENISDCLTQINKLWLKSNFYNKLCKNIELTSDIKFNQINHYHQLFKLYRKYL